CPREPGVRPDARRPQRSVRENPQARARSTRCVRARQPTQGLSRPDVRWGRAARSGGEGAGKQAARHPGRRAAGVDRRAERQGREAAARGGRRGRHQRHRLQPQADFPGRASAPPTRRSGDGPQGQGRRDRQGQDCRGRRRGGRYLRMTRRGSGSRSLLLVMAGVIAMVGLAVYNVAAYEASQASVVRVYLASDATSANVDSLKARLIADPRVASVTYVSTDQALKDAQNRPGLVSLGSLSTTNPFPASLDVTARWVNQVGAIASEVAGDPAVDPTYPNSYDPDMYSRLRHIALVFGGIGAALLLIFAVVAYAVSANSMRGVAAARKEEVTITRLLGARGWMLRGPFVVEGLMTGALAGARAGGLAGAGWLLANRFAAATYAQVLPGVGLTSMRYVVAGLIVAGMLLGALTAPLGFRRSRE